MPLTPIRTLAGKWLGAAFLLLAAGIGALWHSALSAYESAVLRERGRELQAIAELKIEFIRFWLEERRSDALVQSRRPLLAIALTGVDADKWPYGLAALPGQLEAIRKEYGYESVMLLDRDGNHGFSAGAAGDYARTTAAKAARASMAEGRVVISRAYVYLAESDGRRHVDIDIAAPIVNNRLAGTQSVGALVFHLDPREHLDPFLQQWPSPSESGETFLFERSDDEIVYLSSLRHAEATTMRRRIEDPALPAALAARGEQGVIEGIDYRGVPVLAAVGQVPDMPWFVVAKLDREEVLAPVRREALWSGALSALLVLALGLAMLSWQRRGQSDLALAQQNASREALAASEARFRKLIENAWDLLVLFDRDMRIVYASPSVEQQLGGRLTGESIASGTALVHPEDVGLVEAARVNSLARPGLPQRFEHRVRGRYDHWMIVEANFTNHFDDPDIGTLTYVGRDITERKWAEQALRDSEERYRFLFKLSPDAVFLHRNGVVFQTNDAAVRLFRAGSDDELIGRHWRELVDPERWPSVEQRIAQLESGEQAYLRPSEQRYLALDGQPIEVEATGARIVVDGQPAILSVVRDITERKRAEAELKDSEARYRFLFENNPLPMWVFDTGSLAFLEVNQTAIDQYGYAREEFLAMTLRDIRPPEEVAELERAVKAEVRTQGQIWTHRRKDGSLLKAAIWFQDVHFLGRPARMILAENVTARVKAEQALAQSESTLRTFLDSIPGVAIVMDTKGTVYYANRLAAEALGVKLEQMIGANAFSTLPPDIAARRLPKAKQAMLENRIIRFEDNRDGRDIESFFCPIPDSRGIVFRLAVLAFDITDRKQAEERRLEYARQQRDTLVREVHHRIKNHLQGLAGLLRQHMAQQALRPVLEEVVAQINAISIVHGLQGREKGDTSLRNLAAEIAAFLGSITGSRIDLNCPAHGCLWAVAEAEAVPLALVLNELLTNALRHGTDKTRVSLSMDCDGNRAQLIIRNPGRLGAGLDFAHGKGLGTGLGLIRSLLPMGQVVSLR